MPTQPTNNNQPKTPPASPLTPQEWEELERGHQETAEFLKRKMAQRAQAEEAKSGGEVVPPPTPTPPTKKPNSRTR